MSCNWRGRTNYVKTRYTNVCSQGQKAKRNATGETTSAQNAPLPVVLSCASVNAAGMQIPEGDAQEAQNEESGAVKVTLVVVHPDVHDSFFYCFLSFP